MIVGRKKELAILEEITKDDKSHFVAVYGRRRIGKTFLIREAYGYRFTFQHAGLSNGNLKEQLFEFQASIKNSGGKPTKKAKNWLEAFEDLKELIRNSTEKKKIIFIDAHIGTIQEINGKDNNYERKIVIKSFIKKKTNKYYIFYNIFLIQMKKIFHQIVI